MHRNDLLPSTRQSIASIEILRGLAACLVVWSHVARHVDRDAAAPLLIKLFQPGHAGVDLFFTLSGFIILLVHRSDIGRPERLRHYAVRRLSRVMPLYWIALAASLVIAAAGQHGGFPGTPSLIWWAALLPTSVEPLFAIAWTLQYEAMFYLCFALLILSRPLGVLALGGWMLVIVCFLGMAWPPALCRVFGLEFLFGLAAAQILHAVRVPRPAAVAAVGGAAFALAYALESAGLMNGFGTLARFAYGIPAATLIVGLAAAERNGRVLLPRWLEPIGRASYSIYLFQFIFIGTTWQALRLTGLTARLDSVTLFVLLSAASLLGGIAVSRWLERPLLALMRRPHRPAVAHPVLLAP